MGISLVISGFPAKSNAEYRKEAIKVMTDEGIYTASTKTVISESGLEDKWDIDVYAVLAGFQVRIPALCTEDVGWEAVCAFIEESDEDMSGEWLKVLRP